MGISVSCEWCTAIIHLNLVYNPNHHIQASGRALRATQKKKVFVYFLYWNDPVGSGAPEGKILELQTLKW